jgi:hypothetical protein
MRAITALLGISALLFAQGCAIHQTQYDQDKIRCTLNTLYENQIIDNLIRAANGLPFTQIDYSNATSTVTVLQTGDIGTTQDAVRTRELSLPMKALTLTKELTNHIGWGIHGENSNQIALTANPVLNNNEVYDAYLQFLANPGSLVVSEDPPAPERAHVCRKWHGKYYWVPIEYRFLYLRLALITTAQRGKRLQPPDDFFAVSVQEILHTEEGERGTSLLTVRITAPVTNDTGRIEFVVDGKTARYPVTQLPSVNGVRPDSDTAIRIAFDPRANDGAISSVQDFQARLPIDGKLFLEHSHPEPPDTDTLLQSLRFQLEQIRLNQLRIR